MNADLQTLLGNLDEHVKGEMAGNPEIVDKGDSLDINAPPFPHVE